MLLGPVASSPSLWLSHLFSGAQVISKCYLPALQKVKSHVSPSTPPLRFSGSRPRDEILWCRKSIKSSSVWFIIVLYLISLLICNIMYIYIYIYNYIYIYIIIIIYIYNYCIIPRREIDHGRELDLPQCTWSNALKLERYLQSQHDSSVFPSKAWSPEGYRPSVCHCRSRPCGYSVVTMRWCWAISFVTSHVQQILQHL